MKDFMTIADLAIAFRGISRDAVVLLDTPDGPKPLRMVRGTPSINRDGKLVASGGSQATGYAVILSTDPNSR